MLNADKLHIIGIGGIGISALAFWALKEGATVSGSDSADSALLNDLRHSGAMVFLEHKAENLGKDVELVLYTEAIDFGTNPEYKKAKKLGLRMMSYFQALGEISKSKKTIVVAGTKGKTTTTAMLGLGLIAAGLDPTVIVGSKVREFNNPPGQAIRQPDNILAGAGRNLYIGGSNLFVVEACEYRRSFLNFKPFGALILNCVPDHLDYYKDEDDYVSAFIDLVKKVPKNGFVVYNQDDKNACRAVKNSKARLIGVSSKNHKSQIPNYKEIPSPKSQISSKSNPIQLQILGEFNQLNALHALRAAEALGADPNKVIRALENFKGVWRRMEFKGLFQGAPVYDDYGHHPLSIKPTLEAFKQAHPGKRLICVYQPHQYSRTYQLLDDFKTAFGAADTVLVPNIYAARDSAADKKRINAEKFVDAISENHPDARWTKDFDNTYEILKKEVTSNDVVIVGGAGDITELADRLVA